MDESPRPAIYLYGPCPKQSVYEFITQSCSQEYVNNVDSIMMSWKNAADAFSELVMKEYNIAETVNVQDVPEDIAAAVEGVKNDPVFKKNFSYFPVDIKWVEIGKIIVPQRVLVLDHIQKLKEQLGEHPSNRDLVEFCLRPNSKPDVEYPLKLDDTTCLFKSSDPSLMFLGAYSERVVQSDLASFRLQGIPSASFTLFFGYTCNIVNVFSVGKRLVLNNGLHRLYALKSLGYTHAPVVVQYVQNPDTVLPETIIEYPREFLLHHPRPPMVRGFFNSSICLPVSIKKPKLGIKVSWNIEHVRL